MVYNTAYFLILVVCFLTKDTDKGCEIAWNEIRFLKSGSPSRSIAPNRFDSVQTLSTICDKLKSILNYLCKLDHSNILKFYDYWQVDNAKEFKLVVISESSAGGSLKKLLDSSKRTKSKIKSATYCRWLNQILYSIKCLHNENMSFFQGHLAAETIFIQNSGVIKLAPTLLSLCGVCEISNGLVRCPSSLTRKLNIVLSDEFRRRDFQAIGKLAFEIFTAHVRTPHTSTPSSPHPHHPAPSRHHSTFDLLTFIYNQSDDCLNRSEIDLSLLEDEMQRDFCMQCFSRDASIESIWLHPFINSVHSLKVLSVFSILNFFQEKRAHAASNSINQTDKKDGEHVKVSESTLKLNDLRIVCNFFSFSKAPLLIINNNEEILSEAAFSSKQADINNNSSNQNSNKEETADSPQSNQSTTSLVHKELERKSSSTASLNRMMRGNQAGMERRKVSLTFLTNCNNLKIPQDFFNILEDIRSGLYPRLFSKDNCDLKDSTTVNLRAIAPSTCLDFVIEQKKIIDRRSSVNEIDTLSSRRSLFKASESTDAAIKEEDDYARGDGMSRFKYPPELRRLVSETCMLKLSEADPNMIELNVDLKFNDSLTRQLQSYFPMDFLTYLKHDYELENTMQETPQTPDFASRSALKTEYDLLFDSFAMYDNIGTSSPLNVKIENICTHLANELIDHGLINPKDHNLVFDCFYRTVRDYLTNKLKI